MLDVRPLVVALTVLLGAASPALAAPRFDLGAEAGVGTVGNVCDGGDVCIPFYLEGRLIGGISPLPALSIDLRAGATISGAESGFMTGLGLRFRPVHLDSAWEEFDRRTLKAFVTGITAEVLIDKHPAYDARVFAGYESYVAGGGLMGRIAFALGALVTDDDTHFLAGVSLFIGWSN